MYFSGGIISKIVSSPARRRRAFSSENDEFLVFSGNLGIFGTCHLDAQAKVRFRVLLDIPGVCNELKCEEMLEFGVIQECEMEGEFRGVFRLRTKFAPNVRPSPPPLRGGLILNCCRADSLIDSLVESFID